MTASLAKTICIVTDGVVARPAEAVLVCYWNRRDVAHQACSIPTYIEENSDRLRRQYLAFVYDLGETIVDGKSLKHHLTLKRGYSLWWMSLLAEKSLFKSPRIVDCLKLLALDEILQAAKPSAVRLVSDDQPIAIAIKDLCHHFGYYFTWQRSFSNPEKLSFRGLCRKLGLRKPYLLQGFISLFSHIRARWPLQQLERSHWFSGKQSIFLMSYFIHLDPTKCALGQFYSKQWEVLPDLLKELGGTTNWIHHFLFSATVPNVQAGLSWLNQFNRDAINQGQHAFLDSYLTWPIIFDVCREFLHLSARNRCSALVADAFRSSKSAAWFWPVLKQDWLNSVCGPVAIQNLLWIELFDAAMADLPKQTLGLYLQENQGWERAFIHAWKRYGHGHLIGVAHSTVRYWDLRYFDDSQTLTSDLHHDCQNHDASQPRPHATALNGAAARQAYLEANYPEDEILSVEALRYLGLANLRESSQGYSLLEDPSPSYQAPMLDILLLGDILFEPTQGMIQCIEGSLAHLGNTALNCSFLLREHPACPIPIDDYKTLQIEKTVLSICEVIQNRDLVIVSGSTSAILDVYLAGVPVICFVPGDMLNLSPLRGCSSVSFVSTAEEMSTAILSSTTQATSEPQDYFWLDPSLPRWRKVLKASGFSKSTSASISVADTNG